MKKKKKNKEEEEEEEEEQYSACSQDNQDECEASTSQQVVPPTKQKDARFYRKQLRKVRFEGHRWGKHLQAMRHVEVEFPMVVATTCTTVDVLWQDGTRQHGRPSTTLVPFGIMNEQALFPGEHVVAHVLPISAEVDATVDPGYKKASMLLVEQDQWSAGASSRACSKRIRRFVWHGSRRQGTLTRLRRWSAMTPSVLTT